MEGDLVLVSGGSPLSAWETRQSSDEDAPPARRRSPGGGKGRAGGRGRRRGRKKAGPEGGDNDERDEGGSPAAEHTAVTVTAEQARAGTFGIEHVVIPLAGAAGGVVR